MCVHVKKQRPPTPAACGPLGSGPEALGVTALGVTLPSASLCACNASRGAARLPCRHSAARARDTQPRLPGAQGQTALESSGSEQWHKRRLDWTAKRTQNRNAEDPEEFAWTPPEPPFTQGWAGCP